MKKKKKLSQKKSLSAYIPLAKQISLYSFFVMAIVLVFVSLSIAFDSKARRTVGVLHEKEVILPEAKLQVEIADTEKELEYGLSGRTSIASNEGMLFVMPTMGQYGFWMKDMKFPLDIVWISDEGRVVNIVENALPSSYPKKTFKNDAFAKYVLEMKAETARKSGLYLGTAIILPSISPAK